MNYERLKHLKDENFKKWTLLSWKLTENKLLNDHSEDEWYEQKIAECNKNYVKLNNFLNEKRRNCDFFSVISEENCVIFSGNHAECEEIAAKNQRICPQWLGEKTNFN